MQIQTSQTKRNACLENTKKVQLRTFRYFTNYYVSLKIDHAHVSLEFQVPRDTTDLIAGEEGECLHNLFIIAQSKTYYDN